MSENFIAKVLRLKINGNECQSLNKVKVVTSESQFNISCSGLSAKFFHRKLYLTDKMKYIELSADGILLQFVDRELEVYLRSKVNCINDKLKQTDVGNMGFTNNFHPQNRLSHNKPRMRIDNRANPAPDYSSSLPAKSIGTPSPTPKLHKSLKHIGSIPKKSHVPVRSPGVLPLRHANDTPPTATYICPVSSPLQQSSTSMPTPNNSGAFDAAGGGDRIDNTKRIPLLGDRPPLTALPGSASQPNPDAARSCTSKPVPIPVDQKGTKVSTYGKMTGFFSSQGSGGNNSYDSPPPRRGNNTSLHTAATDRDRWGSWDREGNDLGDMSPVVSPLSVSTKDKSTSQHIELRPDSQYNISSMFPKRTASSISSLSFFGSKRTQSLGTSSGGIQNMGNTCYMAAVVQALLFLPLFVTEVTDVRWDGALQRAELVPLNSTLVDLTNIPQRALENIKRMVLFKEVYSIAKKHLHNVLQPMSNEAGKTSGVSSGLYEAIDLHSLKKAIDQYSDQFSGFGQQDAHEFLSEVLDTINRETDFAIRQKPMAEECKEVLCGASTDSACDGAAALQPRVMTMAALTDCSPNTTMATESPLSIRVSPSSACSVHRNNQSLNYRVNALPTRLFQSIMQVTMTCQDCGYERCKDEPYRDLSLDLPAGRPDTTVLALSDLLESFFNEQDDRVVTCERCHGNSSYNTSQCSPHAAHTHGKVASTSCSYRSCDSTPLNVSNISSATTRNMPDMDVSGLSDTSSECGDHSPAAGPKPNHSPAAGTATSAAANVNDSAGTVKVRNLLVSAPNILVIHLKRFVVNGRLDGFVKSHSEVSFPLELDLSKFCHGDVELQPLPSVETVVVRGTVVMGNGNAGSLKRGRSGSHCSTEDSGIRSKEHKSVYAQPDISSTKSNSNLTPEPLTRRLFDEIDHSSTDHSTNGVSVNGVWSWVCTKCTFDNTVDGSDESDRFDYCTMCDNMQHRSLSSFFPSTTAAAIITSQTAVSLDGELPEPGLGSRVTEVIGKYRATEDIGEVSNSVDEASSSSTSAAKVNYSLKSVIRHIGSDAVHGHYITDVYDKGCSTGWKRCNDSFVTPISENHVFSELHSPYIFCYERVHNR